VTLMTRLDSAINFASFVTSSLNPIVDIYRRMCLIYKYID
jgi:hypothetical protein